MQRISPEKSISGFDYTAVPPVLSDQVGKRRAQLLYRLMRGIIKLGLGIFFQRIEVRHGERVPQAGPVVFVVNHPNSIMDALVLGAVIKRKLNYIAHAGLFRTRLMNWFLRSCGVIPVHRRQDDPDKMEQNVNAFRACYETLEAGEAIGIFPEGTSDMLRKIKKVKTGAARIVLETEARNSYALGVKLIPVGLHFFSRSHFRSRVLVNFGEPVPLMNYFTRYQQDPIEGVRSLTAEIQSRLEALTVNIREEELDEFVRDIERLYRDELKSPDPAIRHSPKATVEEFIISQKIAECVQYYQDHDPQRVAEMRERVETYKRKLARLHLRDNMLKDGTTSAAIWRETIRLAALSLAGLPMAVYGIINNFIPYRIAEICAKKFLDERTKILLALLIGGGLAFLVFYAVQISVVAYFLGAVWATLYGVSLPVSGFFALAYLKRVREYRRRVSFSFFLFTNRHLITKMRRARRQLIRAMDQVREEFLALQAAHSKESP
ncbi:MAG: lysophospholipid acyltransferase family protein [candidate division KSB1 bacterium]|nr:lysophospholipid acyltransferase family protein [candidate division KSB1 bacterium]